MKRTKHTCEIINANNIPVIYDDRLIERDGGVLTNTVLDDYYFKEYYNYYSDNFIYFKIYENLESFLIFLLDLVPTYL